MKESEKNKDAMDLCAVHCPGAVIYKLADRWTSGIPDSTIAWREYTSWLEFKMLHPLECIHEQLDPVQLVECRKLEAATGRCWIIAYRKANPKHRTGPRPACLEIYRPSALWDNVHHEVVPGGRPLHEWTALENVALETRMLGISRFEGFDHRAVVSLIHLTHRREYDPR